MWEGTGTSVYVVPFLIQGEYMSELKFGKGRRGPGIDFYIVRRVLVWLVQIALVCGVAFFLVWMFGQRVSNVGDSMNPVLENGDVVLVNSIVYDARNPKRGEIMVFKPKGNENSHYYIKRVIGRPGETVDLIDGELYIDGEKLEEKYETTAIKDAGLLSESVTLEENEYFVLGDNRMSSEDSRNPDIGVVEKSCIEGKAWFVIMPRAHLGFLR